MNAASWRAAVARRRCPECDARTRTGGRCVACRKIKLLSAGKRGPHRCTPEEIRAAVPVARRRGFRIELARAFGVHPTTIWRALRST